MKLKIAIVGAGSQEFGPASIRDVLLSDALCAEDLHLVLMDINGRDLPGRKQYAERVAAKLNRKIRISQSTGLERALAGADFVITAIEIKRYYYWSQDFHIPRKYGFKQIYGENGGPGGLFHALRNFVPMLQIAETMARVCPKAWMINFSNPLTKICQMLSQCSVIKTVGLCHGVFMGKLQLAAFLGLDVHELKAYASGLNHFTWFHSIHHAKTGEDLYPLLKEREASAHWLADWDEIALSRLLYRVYGLYPSPGTNHIGEYVRWAAPLLASQQLQYFYDPRRTAPWKENKVPTYLYNLNTQPTNVPLWPEKAPVAMYVEKEPADPTAILPSGELAIPLIEGLALDVNHEMAAVNIPNKGLLVPGLDEEAIIEVPALLKKNRREPMAMPRLPEGPLAMLHTQTSINKLLVEAFTERSRDKLLQAVLLDPTVDSYHQAVHMINEMCDVQKDVLPELAWK